MDDFKSDEPAGRDWLVESQRHDMTFVCERGLRAASGITWQRLGSLASGGTNGLGRDFYDPTRVIIAAYLRHTGRVEEAREVEAIACNEPPPRLGFGELSALQKAELKAALQGL